MKIILSVFFVLLMNFSNSQSKAKEIIKETSKTIEQIETLQYDLFSWEAFGEKIKHQKMFVKLRKNPFEVYVKTKTINNGAEMLYSENQKKATINLNKKFTKNIKLDPMSKIITKGMHHTLFESGFDYFNNITKSFLKEEKNLITETKDTLINKKEVVKVTVSKKEFRLEKYKIKKKETIRDICLNKNINTYFVYRKNKKTLKNKKKITGEIILIPNSYAEKIELYIEKERQIPVQINVYIEKKLFEKYVFKNIKINPKYDKNEITIKNKNYGF